MKKSKARDANASKARILAAAKHLFTEKGFEGTTIRAIADRAAIHFSLVMRYFGSKEDLFLTAVEWNLHLPQLSAVPKRQRGRVLIRHFLNEWESQEHAQTGLPAMLRVALSHPQGPQFLVRVFSEQVAPCLRESGAANPSRAAALVATQTLGLALTRYVLRIPAVVQLSVDELEEVVGATLQRYLE